jgi:hypothetical protein
MLFLQISTDPSQQFSAPFKAGNSRQVQTSYKPQNTTQRKLATLYPVYTSSGETGVLMTLKHRELLAHIVIFTLTWHKLWHLVAAVLNNVVITPL